MTREFSVLGESIREEVWFFGGWGSFADMVEESLFFSRLAGMRWDCWRAAAAVSPIGTALSGTPLPFGRSSPGQDETTRGLNKANRGLDKANWGLDKTNWGLDKANRGLDKANKGLDKTNRGLDKTNRGLNKTNWGLNKANWGLDKTNRGLNKANWGLNKANRERHESLKGAERKVISGKIFGGFFRRVVVGI